MVKIFESQDGSTSLFSEKFEVSYHSKYGAIQESKHVFIGAGLHPMVIGRSQVSVLEMGFGTGLNAYLTFLEADRLEVKINYTGLEQFPIPTEMVAQLNYPEKVEKERDAFEEIHEREWGRPHQLSDYFSLQKIHSSIQEAKLTDKFDVIYFDAFAPNVQPELWEEDMMSKCFNWLNNGGALVTYCAKGAFKRTLRSVGFQVEALQGPPGKREMTKAVKAV